MPDTDARTLLTAHALAGLLGQTVMAPDGSGRADSPTPAYTIADAAVLGRHAVALADACLDRLGYCQALYFDGRRCYRQRMSGSARVCYECDLSIQSGGKYAPTLPAE